MALGSLVASCSSLTELSFSKMACLLHPGLMGAIAGHTRLKRLSLEWSLTSQHFLNEAFCVAFAALSRLQELQSLELSGSGRISRHLGKVLPSLQQLRHVGLSWVDDVEDKDVDTILQSCRKLQTLHLNQQYRLSRMSLSALGMSDKVRPLRVLNLSCVKFVTDDGRGRPDHKEVC